MSAENQVVYELDEPPSEVADKVVKKIHRAERALTRDGSPEKARRAFRDARKHNIKLMSAISVMYNLNKEEIKNFVGRDVSDINDDLQRLATRMGIAELQMERRGDCDIEMSIWEDIKDVSDEVENFHDLLVGIEEGQAQIQKNA